VRALHRRRQDQSIAPDRRAPNRAGRILRRAGHRHADRRQP
jgi:hypothetical protein